MAHFGGERDLTRRVRPSGGRGQGSEARAVLGSSTSPLLSFPFSSSAFPPSSSPFLSARTGQSSGMVGASQGFALGCKSSYHPRPRARRAKSAERVNAERSTDVPNLGITFGSGRIQCSSLPREMFGRGKELPKVPTIAYSFPNLSGWKFNLPLRKKIVKENDLVSLFPGVEFNCYHTILPWVRRASEDAFALLKSLLPKSGPIIAYHLGSLLSFIMFTFDLYDFSLPNLVENYHAGYKFLHFDSGKVVHVRNVVAKLYSTDAFVGGGQGIDPVNMINTAASVGAVTIASNDASTMYREMIKNLTPVSIILSEEDKEIIKRERMVHYTNAQTYTGDHALMAAYREIIRYDLTKVVNINNTTARTLVLGATDREFRCYANNVHVFFQLANREGKDIDRMVVEFLLSLRRVKAKKVKKNKVQEITLKRNADEVLFVDDMLLQWRSQRKLPPRFLTWDESRSLIDDGVVPPILSDHRVMTDGSVRESAMVVEPPRAHDPGFLFDSKQRICDVVRGIFSDAVYNLVPRLGGQDPPPTFDMLIFEDVGYNFTKNDWYRIFKNTGATVAYGYLCLPWELKFPQMVPSPGYSFRTKGSYSQLAYGGYSNGYCHMTKAWSTLMDGPAMVFMDMTIGIEHVSRVGPMVCVKLFLSDKKEVFVRQLELPKHLKTVLVLDIRKSMTFYTGKIDYEKLVYFPVRLDEFEDSLNYAMDIAKESLNFRNILLFVRRRTSGLSLVTKELSKTWAIDRGHLLELASVVYMLSIYYIGKFAKNEDMIMGMRSNVILDFLRLFMPVRIAVKFISKILGLFMFFDNFHHILVKEVPESIWQEVHSNFRHAYKRGIKLDTSISPEDFLDDDANWNELEDKIVSDCFFCDELAECIGSQKVICNRGKPEIIYHNFALSDSELKKFRSRLEDNSNDPPGLRAVKMEALGKVPLAAFSSDVRIYYICGPPGTGKSYAVRGLATRGDLVMAPFTRLKEDYTDFIHPLTGRKTSLKFTTQHSALKELNHSRIFVDEYTAMPYEFLAIAVFLCGTKEVYLVGDHRQPGIINEIEGISISSKIDVTELRSHELVKNFRNPSDAVCCLNTLYSYRMEATNDNMGFVFDTIENYKNYVDDNTTLFFRYETATNRFGIPRDTTEKITVRSNQGATYENVLLTVTDEDEQLFNMPSMAIVALSRHRNRCVVLYEPNGPSNVFVSKIMSTLPERRRSGTRPNRRGDGGEDSSSSDDDNDDHPPGSHTTRGRQFSSRPSRDDQLVSHEGSGGNQDYSRLGPQTNPSQSTEELVNQEIAFETRFLLEGSESVDQALPTDNTCLLDTLEEILPFSKQQIWNKFVNIYGQPLYRVVSSSGLSTSELDTFCTVSGFRLKVVNKYGRVVNCGNRGRMMGTILFDLPPGAGTTGHFSNNSDPQMPPLEEDVGVNADDEREVGHTTPTNLAVVSTTTSNSVQSGSNNNVPFVDLTSCDSPNDGVPTDGLRGFGKFKSLCKYEYNNFGIRKFFVLLLTFLTISTFNFFLLPLLLTYFIPRRYTTYVTTPFLGFWYGGDKLVNVNEPSKQQSGSPNGRNTRGVVNPHRRYVGPPPQTSVNPLTSNNANGADSMSRGIVQGTTNREVPRDRRNRRVTFSDRNESVSIPNNPPMVTPRPLESVSATLRPTNSRAGSQDLQCNVDGASTTESEQESTPGNTPHIPGRTSMLDTLRTGTNTRTLGTPYYRGVHRDSEVPFSGPARPPGEVTFETRLPSFGGDLAGVSTSNDKTSTPVPEASTETSGEGGATHVHELISPTVKLVNILDDTDIVSARDSLRSVFPEFRDITLLAEVEKLEGQMSNLSRMMVSFDTPFDRCDVSSFSKSVYKNSKLYWYKNYYNKYIRDVIHNLQITFEVSNNDGDDGNSGGGDTNNGGNNDSNSNLDRSNVRNDSGNNNDTNPGIDSRNPNNGPNVGDVTTHNCAQTGHDISSVPSTTNVSGSNVNSPVRRRMSNSNFDEEMRRRIQSSVRRVFAKARASDNGSSSDSGSDVSKTDSNLMSEEEYNKTFGKFSRYVPKWVGGNNKQMIALPKLGVVEPRSLPPEPLTNSEIGFVDMARLFTSPIFVTDFLVEMLPPIEDPFVSLEQTGYDAFRAFKEDFATISESDLNVTNEETLGYFDPNFGGGTFDLTTLDNLNPRGHVKKQSLKAYSLLSVAPGTTYFKNNLNQSLSCLQARYLTKAMSTVYNYESQKKADEIADLFFFEHMNLDMDTFNEQDVYMTTLDSEHSMKIKNYEKQVKFDVDGDVTVRFNMKDIFKPFKSSIDIFKPGQGISAWSKDAQTIFQTAFRLINKHFVNSLKPHVVFDNGIDEITLMNRVNALFLALPDVAMNGVIDATACDSGQNRFTQRIERRMLENLGIHSDFLDWYYEFREEYTLKGYGVVARIKDIKTSGEPATLLNNTILMACLMNYLVRGEGPCVLVIKGDDGLKRQANIVYHDDLKEQLKKYLKMEFRVDIDVPITFCGYFLYQRYLIPDLFRKVFKILGHKFRDYEHFREYQESLRDWILNVNKLGVNDVCYIAAKSYNSTEDYTYHLFQAIVSLSHIRAEQFYKEFTYRTYDWSEVGHPDNKWKLKTDWYKGDN